MDQVHTENVDQLMHELYYSSVDLNTEVGRIPIKAKPFTEEVMMALAHVAKTSMFPEG
jgi:hypothetical protein